MTTFGRDDDLKGARFDGADLRGARFVSSDLSGVVMRGVEVSGAEVDSPWLDEGDGFVVNDVDVADYVEAELARPLPRQGAQARPRPGRAAVCLGGRRGRLGGVAATGRVDAGRHGRGVGGGRVVADADPASPGAGHGHVVGQGGIGGREAVGAILRLDEPFHPLGLLHDDGADDGHDLSVFTDRTPTFDEVLEVRAERTAMVSDFLVGVTDETLAERRPNLHAPDYAETVRSCLHTILAEEWEHLRYASRDLDAIEGRIGPGLNEDLE